MSLMLGANIWAGARGGMATAPSAWAALLDSLQTETDGMVLYFTDPDYPRAIVRDTTTPANDFDGDANSVLTYTSPSLKNVMGADGTIKYADHNLITYSSDLSNGAWTKGDTTAPSASVLQETATTAAHFISPSSVTGLIGAAQVWEAELKYVNVQWINVAVFVGSAWSHRAFDVQNGVEGVSNGADFASSSMTAMGDGWYRCRVTSVPATDAGVAFRIVMTQSNSTTVFPSYAGNTANQVMVRNAQVRRGPVHIYDHITTTTAAKYRLPIDHDSAGDPLGLLVEEARTNLALYSSDFTNAAWTKSNMTTAQTATGPGGTANGATTLTATAGNATALQAITSASAARITSTYIKRRTGTGNIDLTQDNGSTWTTVTVTSSWTRVNIASVTSTNPTVGIRIVTSGDAVDIAHFQHEVGAFITSPIRTTSATVTRAADQDGKATSGFPWSATNGMLVVKARPILANSLGAMVSVNDGTGNEEIVLYRDASGNLVYQVEDGGVNQLAPLDSAANAADATAFTMAAAYKANDFAVSVGGAAVVADTGGTLPTVTTLEFGANQANNYFNGWIEWVKYVPRDVSDANLVSESAL